MNALHAAMRETGQPDAAQQAPRPASQASSTRGPLKMSSLNMRDRTTSSAAAPALGQGQAAAMHDQPTSLSSAAKGGLVDLRHHPPLPAEQQQPAAGRGFLKTLQASMPREVGLLTGARRGTVLERAPLPGVAEETASALVATDMTPPAAQHTSAPDTQHAVAHAQQQDRPHSPQRQRWSALYQYFVGRPAGSTAVNGRRTGPLEQTPALQPPPNALPPPAVLQPHAHQPQQQQQQPAAQPATKSPPYYTPPAMHSDASYSTAPQGAGLPAKQQSQAHAEAMQYHPPAWLAGNAGLKGHQIPHGHTGHIQAGRPGIQHLQHQPTLMPQMSRQASRPGALPGRTLQRNTSEFAPANLAPSAPPGLPDSPSGISRIPSTVGGTSGAPSPQPFARGATAGQQAVFPLQGGGAAMSVGKQPVAAHRFAQRWQQMAQKSQSALQAAQQATPAEAQAMLQRVTTLQRQQRAAAPSHSRQ